MLLQIQNLLPAESLAALRKILDGAPFDDGRSTAGKAATKVKHNLQLSAGSEAGKRAGQLVLDVLARDHAFQSATYPRVILPPLFSRYEPGMAYGDHLDNPLMGPVPRVRTDVSLTVFLNDPEEYDGGELVIHSDFGTSVCKGRAGDAVAYPSTLLHRVEPVTRGFRLVAVTWIQSLVRDALRRRILFDLSTAATRLSKDLPGRDEGPLVAKCLANLVRMWAET
jgi:PKHD-type hydroxylase